MWASSALAAFKALWAAFTLDEFDPVMATRWLVGIEGFIILGFLVACVNNKENISLIFNKDEQNGGALCKYLNINKKQRSGYVSMLQNNTEGFRIYWIGLWTCWLLFYAYKFFRLLVSGESTETHNFACALTNNVTSMALLGCYYFLASTCEESASFGGILSRKLLFPFLVLLLLIGLDVYIYYEITPSLRDICARGMVIIEGMVSCVILSMWIGRIDSKFLSPPRILIAILYIFAAAQVLLPIMAETALLDGLLPNVAKGFMDMTRFALVLIGLMGKVIMFWIITKNYHDGHLMFYFVRLKQIIDGRGKQLEMIRLTEKLKTL